MDFAAIERRLRGFADVHVVDARELRHVIKRHRHVSGLVPHERCYGLTRAELDRLGSDVSSLVPPEPRRHWVILVAKPSQRELRRGTPKTLEEGILRAAFHARVHLELEEKARRGQIDSGRIKRRIEDIGRTEFAEIRNLLAHDDLLLPPRGDLEAYVEFVATYLELRLFAPGLVAANFPGLDDHEHLDEILAQDIDVGALIQLDEARGHIRSGSIPSRISFAPASGPARSSREGSRGTPLPEQARKLSARGQGRWMKRAARAAAAGNHALSAVCAARAVNGNDSQAARQAEQALANATQALQARLLLALETGLSDAPGSQSWAVLLSGLARSASLRDRPKSSPEYHVLCVLQRAAASYEAPGVLVDLPSWILSGGHRNVVRSRQDTRHLQVARILQQASSARLHTVERRRAELRGLERLVRDAQQRAEGNARCELRPRIRTVLRDSRFAPGSGPERQAFDKLVEELMDAILDRGFISLPQLRDAVSRNEAKLADVSETGQLWHGDALLRADAGLAVSLDGIYRRGDAYLRVLQQVSSIPFGTQAGRWVTLNLLLPALGSFTLLEGIRLILGGAMVWLGFSPMGQPSAESLLVVGLAILALIHSQALRVFARQTLDILGMILAWTFFRIPRAVLLRPWVQHVLSLPWVRSLLRRLVVPALLAWVTYLVLPVPGGLRRWGATAGVFAALSAILGSRFGWWLEDYLVEQVAPTWRVFSRRWLPELVRAVGRGFSRVMDAFERGMFRIESLLRFPSRQSAVLIAVSAVLGTVTAAVAYVIRLYVTLLVEPELNPLKHFPVITVAHKLSLPFLPEMLRWIEPPLAVFGPIVGGALAGLTVFLLPSFSGFLVWELKANYRLYRATRSNNVHPAQLGPHGETMQGLLVAGLHSGTLPKLYHRLRRAAQHQYERQAPRPVSHGEASTEVAQLAGLREAIRVVQRAIRWFVERELLSALSATERWKMGELVMDHVESSSNRIRIRLSCRAVDQEPCELTLEQLGDRIVAGISAPGFLAALDATHQLLFENALAVFYHRAEVRIVREQVESELGSEAHYDVVENGLVVWPEPGQQLERVYPLDPYRPRALKPKPWRGDAAQVLDSRRVIYSHQIISWSAWEKLWDEYANPAAPVRRLLAGPSLLPSSVRQARPEVR